MQWITSQKKYKSGTDKKTIGYLNSLITMKKKKKQRKQSITASLKDSRLYNFINLKHDMLFQNI